MRSIKVAGAMMLVVASGVSVLLYLSREPICVVPPGTEMSFSWRLSLYLLNWYIRLAPLIVLVVAGVAVLTALVRSNTSIERERDGLRAWLVLGLALSGSCALLLSLVPLAGGWGYERLRWWMPITFLASAFEGVAWLASLVVAAHLQSRLHKLGARVRGWHVAAAGIVLAILSGSGSLVVALWVWWNSRTASQGLRP